MRIVFHGENAACFSENFAALVAPDSDIAILPDVLETDSQRATFSAADIIIGTRFTAGLPKAAGLRMYHAPAAGYDGIELDALPPQAIVCNCFGHEAAIAEYVMAAILQRAVPIADADAKLRQGDWAYWAGAPARAHGEISDQTIGLLGFGHIGKAIAVRARAFGMRVHAANRSPITDTSLIDHAYLLSELPAFWASADIFVVSLPLVDDTRGIVNAASFAAMPPHALIINVGRGPVIDEAALYEALHSNRIAGAVIDTWYTYPTPADPHGMPGAFPFHELKNLVMTPHMSGWTRGTIRRRQEVVADNIRRLRAGLPCINVVRAARAV